MPSHDLRLLASLDARNVPDNDKLLVVGILSDTREVLAVMREAQALEGDDWHGHHGDAPGSGVVPDADDAVLAFLSRGNHGALVVEVERADRRGVAKEEALLLIGL